MHVVVISDKEGGCTDCVDLKMGGLLYLLCASINVRPLYFKKSSIDMYSKFDVPIIIGHPKRIAIINKKVSIVIKKQLP